MTRPATKRAALCKCGHVKTAHWTEGAEDLCMAEPCACIRYRPRTPRKPTKENR